MPLSSPLTRRYFLSGSAALSLFARSPLRAFSEGSKATAQNATPPQPAPAKSPAKQPMPKLAPPFDRATIDMLGPRSGYSPQIGTLVSMLTWMQPALIGPTRGLTQPQLDFLLDKNANSIGALMLHLAATEVLYQRMTFNGETFDEAKLPPDYDAKWGAAMLLGDRGRSAIKGHPISYYQDTLREVREKTLAEFAKRDDAWFTAALKEPGFDGGPVNNYCLWFHVCEHISHHAGQIDLLMKRMPGAASGSAAG